MSKTTHTRREHLTGNDEGGSVGAEIEEELGDNDKTKSSAGTERRCTSQDTEHEGGDQEATNLNGLAAKELDEGDREEVAGHVTSDGNDQVTLSVVEEVLVWGLAGSVADGGQNDGLVQVDTVESNVDQEPRESTAEESEGVAGVAEVLDKGAHLDGLWWLDGVGLDDGDTAVVDGFTVGLELLLGKARCGGVEGGVGDVGKLNGLLELARFGHGEAEPQEGEARNERQSDLDTPDGIDLVESTTGQGVLEAREQNAGDDRGSKSTLIRV